MSSSMNQSGDFSSKRRGFLELRNAGPSLNPTHSFRTKPNAGAILQQNRWSLRDSSLINMSFSRFSLSVFNQTHTAISVKKLIRWKKRERDFYIRYEASRRESHQTVKWWPMSSTATLNILTSSDSPEPLCCWSKEFSTLINPCYRIRETSECLVHSPHSVTCCSSAPSVHTRLLHTQVKPLF